MLNIFLKVAPNTKICPINNYYVQFTGYISHLSLSEYFSISLLNRLIENRKKSHYRAYLTS